MAWRRWLPGVALVVVGLGLLVLPGLADNYVLYVMTRLFVYVLVALGLNLLTGYAGQVSLGHAAFFGLGAYSAALLGTRWEVSPWIGLLVGAGLATAFGFILGFLSNRLRGPYFVLATIAFSQVLLIVASRWRGLTSVNVPRVSWEVGRPICFMASICSGASAIMS